MPVIPPNEEVGPEKQLTVRMQQQMYDDIASLAEHHGYSINTTVTYLLRWAIQEAQREAAEGKVSARVSPDRSKRARSKE